MKSLPQKRRVKYKKPGEHPKSKDYASETGAGVHEEAVGDKGQVWRWTGSSGLSVK